MRSSRFPVAAALAGALLTLSTSAPRAEAQQAVQGFAVERLYPSAPGGGWFVMDALDMHGGLGGVAGVTLGYARDPLRVTDGTQHLAVVSDQAFADFGFAITYDRLRLYMNVDAPLTIQGQGSGQPQTVGGYALTPPSFDLGSNPDTLSDTRVGFDARLLGEATSPFRLGVGTQLYIPSGDRADYDTDGTYRMMFRVLFAGDAGALTYAGQLGAHVRPNDDAPAPGSPQGSELLFGAAAGAKLPLCSTSSVVIGPEVYGESAVRSLFGSATTGVEGLLTARFERTRDDDSVLRVRLGGGGGIDPHFGAPAWRALVGIELTGITAPR